MEKLMFSHFFYDQKQQKFMTKVELSTCLAPKFCDFILMFEFEIYKSLNIEEYYPPTIVFGAYI